MPDLITVGGVVATPPKNVVTESGLKITSFRLASQQRRYDRASGAWVDGDTNWFTVTTFRGLAENAQASLSKGDRVLVHGRLRLREWTNADRSGMTVEIEADGIGHDLAWGRTEYRRVVRSAPGAEQDVAAEVDAAAAGRENGEQHPEADEQAALVDESSGFVAQPEPAGATAERPEPVGAGGRAF